MTQNVQPSPDWDMVTLKWAGTYLDGSVPEGTVEVTYNSLQPMLDDDPDTPLQIIPVKIVRAITTTSVIIAGEPRTVGYAEFQVPASNDPDIIGGGASYRYDEKFARGGGRQGVNFAADIAAPGGVIWLNRLPGGAPSTPATPLSVVYWSDFAAVEGRVAALEEGGVDIDIPDATTTEKGIARRSTSDEVSAGADVSAWINPAQLKTVTDALSPTIPPATISEAGVVRRASAQEVTDGAAVNAYVVPDRLMALVTNLIAALKAELLGGADPAWDTLQELRALMVAADSEDQADIEAAITSLTTLIGQRQPGAPNLSALAGLTGVADRLPYFSGSESMSLATITSFGRTLVGAAGAEAVRSELMVRVYDVFWTGSAWETIPTWAAPLRKRFWSTHDPAATAPPTGTLLVGDTWLRHPNAS